VQISKIRTSFEGQKMGSFKKNASLFVTLFRQRLSCYTVVMVDVLTTKTVMTSATPTEDEIAGWQQLPRDERLRRMRQALTSPEASAPCTTTMTEVWAEIESDVPAHG
jgi:hypothetical protein